MAEVLNTFMRWLHISSMAALVGGLSFARLAMIPAARALSAEQVEALSERAAAAFRPYALASMLASVLSGFYNVLTMPGHTARYHALLGLKILLAAHLFAVAFLIVRPKCAKRPRLMNGALISGFAIILIAGYLRQIF